MKYQSELIKEIVDTRGHKESSLHYESECMETWIEEAKGGYPKLCDYESEWLKYISILDDTGGSEPPIGEFPYVVLSDVTEATIDNVVPYAYKSAILTGNTLVNLINYKGNFDGREINSDGTFKTDVTKPFQELIVGKEYTFIVYVSQTTVGNISSVAVEFNEKDIGTKKALCVISNPINGVNKVKFTVPSNYGSYLHSYIKTSSISGNVTVKGMIIEGDLTQEVIPYFTGMQSVKMPVLKTVGKNLFDIEKLEGLNVNIEMIPNGIRIKNSQFDITRCFTTPFKENTQYTVSFKHTQIEGTGCEGFRIHYTDGTSSYTIPNPNSSCIGKSLPNKTIESISLSFNLDGTSELTYIQFEEGTTATSYEPFKSNILMVNEDVTLRSNGDIYDELNLLTGQLTQRIDENNEVLSQEVVKTVDLTITNQDGETLNKLKPFEGTMHLLTSSDTIKPLFSGEIPVEAITQNLASFIDLETEE